MSVTPLMLNAALSLPPVKFAVVTTIVETLLVMVMLFVHEPLIVDVVKIVESAPVEAVTEGTSEEIASAKETAVPVDVTSVYQFTPLVKTVLFTLTVAPVSPALDVNMRLSDAPAAASPVMLVTVILETAVDPSVKVTLGTVTEDQVN
jgi:hypothetical protein